MSRHRGRLHVGYGQGLGAGEAISLSMTTAAHVISAVLGTWVRGGDAFLWLYRAVA